MPRYDNTRPKRSLQSTKDYPPPTDRWHTDKGYTTAIRALDVGESVWLPTSANTARALAGALRLRQDYAARHHAVRKETAPAEGTAGTDGYLPELAGARVWRVA